MGRVSASDGVSLHAEAHGEGLPVLFSCALNTTRENWWPQVEPLVRAGYRVVLWDYRGHGRSEAPDAPDAYSMDRVVDDLGRVLDWAAPGVPAVLAGLSFGGLASLHFALRQPARVRALVLAGSGPGFKNPEAQARWESAVGKMASYLERKGVAAFVQSRSVADIVGRRLELPAARRALAAIAEQQAHGLAHFGRRVAAPAAPVIDELASIRIPALVLVGELDDAYQRAAQVMAARLPLAESVTIPRAGHIANIEEPEAFNAALLGFLERLQDRPPRQAHAGPGVEH
jgi:pimeloyl-ACP methyl ester carboxylesterase